MHHMQPDPATKPGLLAVNMHCMVVEDKRSMTEPGGWPFCRTKSALDDSQREQDNSSAADRRVGSLASPKKLVRAFTLLPSSKMHTDTCSGAWIGCLLCR